MNELIDICDENNNIIGQAMKYEALAKGLWHRTARVLVYNSKGQILTQLRSLKKELHPGKWDIGVAGHVGAGEGYLAAALRETAEEAGIAFLGSQLELAVVERFTNNSGGYDEKGFAYTYYACFDGDADILVPQPEEVQMLKFIAIGELESERRRFPKKYVPHSEYYWENIIGGIKNKFNGKLKDTP